MEKAKDCEGAGGDGGGGGAVQLLRLHIGQQRQSHVAGRRATLQLFAERN